MRMWNDIQFDPAQVSKGLRRKCEQFENQLELYDSDVKQEYDDARHILGSLRTEGSTVTDTAVDMIMHGEIRNIQGVKNRDLLECISLTNAVEEARSLISSGVSLSEEVIKRLHKTCSNGLLKVPECGAYRLRQNYIGDMFQTAVPNQIPKLMRRLLAAISVETNPIIKAAVFGFNYVSIHPFIDFNGRTCRLFECYLLGLGGYPFISLTEEDIPQYFEILKAGQLAGKPYYEPYVAFLFERVNVRFEELSVALKSKI